MMNKVNAPANATFDTLLDFVLFFGELELLLSPLLLPLPLPLEELPEDELDGLVGFSSDLFEVEADIIAKHAKGTKVLKVFIGVRVMNVFIFFINRSISLNF